MAAADKLAWLENHEQGWRHYRAREFRQASDCFSACPPLGLDDTCLHGMLERCRQLGARPPDDAWEPVTRMEEK